jgi:hypothetical protein
MIAALEQANLVLRLLPELLMLALVTLAGWRSPGAGASWVPRGAVAASTLAGRRGQKAGGVFLGSVLANAALVAVWDQ